MSIDTKIQSEKSIINIEPSVKPIGVSIFITLILIGFIIVLIQSIIQLINGNFNVFFTIIAGLFFWTAFYNFFQFYWLILGNEIIEIHSDYLKQTKVVWKLRNSKKFKKTKISDIRILDASNTPFSFGYSFFGSTNVFIQFKYGKKKKMIGNKINQKEAEEILKELENRKYAT